MKTVALASGWSVYHTLLERNPARVDVILSNRRGAETLRTKALARESLSISRAVIDDPARL